MHVREFLQKRVTPFLGLLIFALAMFPGVFTGGIWASCGIAGGVLAFILLWAENGRPPMPRQDILFLSGLLVLTSFVVGFMSEHQSIALHMALQLATITLPLSVLSSKDVQERLYHPAIFSVGVWVFVAALVAISIEHMAGTPLLHLVKNETKRATEYNRGISYIMMLSWPLMAVLWNDRRRFKAVVLLLALLSPLLLTESRTTMLAMCVATVVFVLAKYAPVFALRSLQVIPSVLAVVWPFAAHYMFINFQGVIRKLPSSWQARSEIWDYLYYRTMEHPVTGWGAGTSYKLSCKSPDSQLYIFTDIPAYHPHNAFSQLWVELGVPGAIFGILFVFMTLRWISALDKRVRPFAFAAWTGCFFISLSAYDFWTDSLLSMFALVCLAFVFAEKRVYTTP